MAFTQSDLLQGAYRKLGQLQAFPATGGSTTSAVVGQLANVSSINKGVLFVTEDGGGASAAPEGEYQRITAYAKNTGTFTTGTFTSAIASGDTVAIANDLYPVHTMEELANDALRALGKIILVDTTTQDTAASQTEYSLITTWKSGIVRVDRETREDSNDNQWKKIWDIEEVPATPGSAGVLIIEQLAAGWDLRIWYKADHPRLNSYADVVDEAINPEAAIWSLVVEALNWQWKRTRDEDIAQDLNDARNELERAKADFPIVREQKTAKMLTFPR